MGQKLGMAHLKAVQKMQGVSQSKTHRTSLLTKTVMLQLWASLKVNLGRIHSSKPSMHSKHSRYSSKLWAQTISVVNSSRSMLSMPSTKHHPGVSSLVFNHCSHQVNISSMLSNPNQPQN